MTIQKIDVVFVHYREKISTVSPMKKRSFRFTAFIHSIRSSKIEPHDFFEKIYTGFVDSSTEHLEFHGNIPDVLYCYPPS